MERKIENSLLSWKNSRNRKPLLLKGARQVGKTWSLLNFGKQHYKNVLYVNFESNTELRGVFERDLSTSRILQELSAFSGQTIFPGDTLIIFDEIQACERALTSLKYFDEESPEYHIAAAGSLLGIAINRNNYSFPVGKVDFLSMYPLDFEEFLSATGHAKATSIIREYFTSNTHCALHETFMDYYYRYLNTGGMPQVINELSDSGDYNLITTIQKNINDAYIADMAKYAGPQETVKIMAAFNSIPAQLAKENRKFQYSVIKSGARAMHYASALEWLMAAGIIIRCMKTSGGIAPLSTQADPAAFKVYMNDTGLLSSKIMIPQAAFNHGMRGYEHIKGALTENYIANALNVNEITPYYWESQGKAEVDFIMQNNQGEVIPIEVKSSQNVRSKSLQQFVAKYHPPYAIRVSTKNFGFENNIKSVPLYAAWCIH